MNLFFEEDGAFKVGSVLSQAGNAYQVELPTGKRTKVKGGHVFFSFEAPAVSQFLETAKAQSAEIDPDFLWETLEDTESGFEEIAVNYFGDGATPVEKAAILLALHANPVYFHRKGRGIYKRAPADILAAAKLALEKRRKLEEEKASWVASMVNDGVVPEAIAQNAILLLTNPDKNSIAYKALIEASDKMRLSPLALLIQLGAIKSAYDWLTKSFYAKYFPSGLGFSAKLPEPDLSPFASYPLASVRAFSIDNLETTEIDDAFSVEDAGENYRIGIHIAAPALAIERDDAIDRVAQSRYSTVYAPGIKVTMLPESWANAFSLFENRDNVCLSLYAVIRKDDFEVITSETRLERVFVAANLRTEKIEASLSPEGLENDTLTIPFAHELSVLYRAAERLQKHREEVRGRPEIKNRTEYSIVLTGEGEDATVSLAERARGAPVDFIVSELMIFANATWGGWLEDTHRAGIYRTQSKGKVKMTSVSGPHDAIGVNSYAWCTSPVRRYVDLVNQRQLISSVENREAVYRASDADLFSIISNFTFTYAAYGDFQRQMERYWSLRYIEQEGFTTLRAVVIKEDLVQLEKMPFLQRIPGLPTLPRGQVIVLNVASIDYVSVVLDATLREVLSENVSDEIDAESMEEVTVEVESQPEAQSA